MGSVTLWVALTIFEVKLVPTGVAGLATAAEDMEASMMTERARAVRLILVLRD